MAVKNYGIHDQWTNLDTLNSVDIKSVDGVIESVKINGEEAGGGSSDFTLASITLSDPDDLGFKMTSAFIPDGSDSISTEFHTNDAGSVNIILYKGSATVKFPDGGIVNTTVSGNATKSAKYITVTGDCTFTINNLEP